MDLKLTFFGICSFVVGSELGLVLGSFDLEVKEGHLLVESAVVVDNQCLMSVADHFLYDSSFLYTWR